ncbi:isochorismatase family protein [Pelagibius litoralis]|uniref:Isochorismatase family protein n=1 Tax=Pelagibius litoralis TaxID=374515 RepID=A0A967CAA2_9PROT|nr:isochorismatase family protein [Pelagibius litoralis]NIA67244.1 isochorismatase family protein [Pelagibius litoralis]
MGLLLVDLQERLAPAIAESPVVIDCALALVAAAKQGALPILATEQYPEGLGLTAARLRRELNPDWIIEKIAFGAPREDAFRNALIARGIGEVIVVGMEAHVCVQQTVLCLLELGYGVSLVGDGVASRAPLNKAVALQRMAAAGARIVQVEQAVARLRAGAERESTGQT